MNEVVVPPLQEIEIKASQAIGRHLQRLGMMFVQAARDFFIDSGPQWAAAVAYYTLLCAFPLVLGAGAVAAYVIEPSAGVEQITRLLRDFVPEDSGRLVGILTAATVSRRQLGLVSIAALLWTGSRVFSVIRKALNIAYDVDETLGFVRRTVIEVVLLLTLGVLIVSALMSRFLIDRLWAMGWLQALGSDVLYQTVRQAVSALLVLSSFALIYRFVPRSKKRWSAVMLGAATATLLFLLARPLFLSFVKQWGTYDALYGPLALAVLSMVWTWLMALILLYGGEVVSHVQAMLIEGKSASEVKRRHLLRAPTRKVPADECAP